MAINKASHISGALQSFTQGIFDVAKLQASDIRSQQAAAASLADSVWDEKRDEILKDKTLTSDEKLLKFQEAEQDVLEKIFATAKVTNEKAKKDYLNSSSWTLAKRNAKARMGAFVADEISSDVKLRDEGIRSDLLKGDFSEEDMLASYTDFITGGINEDGSYKDPIYRPEIVQSQLTSFSKAARLTTVQKNALAALDNDGITLGMGVIDEAYSSGMITNDDRANLEDAVYSRYGRNQRAVNEQLPDLDVKVQDIIKNGVSVPEDAVVTGTPYERNLAAINTQVNMLPYATPTQKQQLAQEYETQLRTAQPLNDFKNFYLTRQDVPEFYSGNIDLASRAAISNQDGTVSTVRSMSFSEDGQEILIPTVVNGKVVSEEEAIKHYHETGEHLGKFSTPEEADAYAQELSQRESGRIGGVDAFSRKIDDIAQYYGMNDVEKAQFELNALAFMEQEQTKQVSFQTMKADEADTKLNAMMLSGQPVTLADVTNAYKGTDSRYVGTQLKSWTDFAKASEDTALWNLLITKIQDGTVTASDFEVEQWHNTDYQKDVESLQVEWKNNGKNVLQVLAYRDEVRQDTIATLTSYRGNTGISTNAYQRAVRNAYISGRITEDDLTSLYSRNEALEDPWYAETASRLKTSLGLDSIDKKTDLKTIALMQQGYSEALQLLEDQLMLNPDMDKEQLYQRVVQMATDNTITKLLDGYTAGSASTEAYETENLFKDKKPQELMQGMRNGSLDGILQQDRMLGWMSKTVTTDGSINPQSTVSTDLFGRNYENLSTFEKNVVDANTLYIQYAQGMKKAAEKQFGITTKEIRMTDRGPAIVDSEGYLYMPAGNVDEYRDWTVHMINAGFTNVSYLTTGITMSPGTEVSAKYFALDEKDVPAAVPEQWKSTSLESMASSPEAAEAQRQFKEAKIIEKLSSNPARMQSEKKKDRTPR